MRIGPFEILETVGGGGSGIVYKARNETLGRVVAVKQLNKQVHEGDRAFNRFRREAQIMASIRSPHVVTLYSYQVVDGRPLLEMECLEHGSLEDLLSAGPLPHYRVLEIVEDILLGLHALHGAGVVHRDIKPGNVLQDDAGRYKLTDFGISITESAAKPTLEAATIRYLAPECISDNPTCDARSDLYSVGMVAYELLLGNEGFHEAFPDVTPIAAFAAKWLRWLKEQGKEATSLHVLRPDIPVPVSNFVARLMAKDPELRYASADAALQAIRLLPYTRRMTMETRPSAPEVRSAPEGPPEASPGTSWELAVRIERPGESETRLAFARSPVLIGSSPQCDVVLGDEYVSAEHARVIVSRGQITFRDQSRNGSFVDGHPIKDAQLGESGEVTIPPFRLSFSLRMTEGRRDTLHRRRDNSTDAAIAAGVPDLPGGDGGGEPGTIFVPMPAHSTAGPVLRLIKAPGNAAGTTFALSGATAVIGRSVKAEIRLDWTTVSRQHVKLQRQPDGRWRAEDLNSANGMAVNGRRVSNHVLSPGDELAVGPDIVFQFLVPTSAGV
jgi:serine/threonine protein kinase